MFINDLPHVVKSMVRLFADDTKLYGSDDTEGGRSQIQDGSSSLSDWSDKWLLKFNTCTCSVKHLGRKKPKHKIDTRDNDGVYQQLEETEVEKDLELNVDTKLSFHHHVNTAVNKTTRVWGLI